MSHIHIPDGVLPLWLWLSGFVLTTLLLAISLRVLRGMDAARKVPLLGVMAAMMIVTMSAEVVPIAYHVNLTVLAGVLLGPALGFVCAFVVDVILALLGHGGVTVVGLNSLMVGTEIALGWLLFGAFVRLFGRARLQFSAALATVCTLAVTTTMVVGMVAISGVNPRSAAETGALNPETLRIENPFAGRPAPAVARAAPKAISLTRFAEVVYVLGVPGWILEALLTSFIIGFIARVRPDLVGLGPPHPEFGEPVTDYGRH